MTDVGARLRRLEDVEEIRALDARYCRLLDEADWPAFVALFTPDGTFDGLQAVTGHDALLAFFSALADSGMTFWHHLSNHEIEVDGDRARVRSLLWQPCVVDGVPHVAAGRYDDRLVRTAEGWRYELKRVRFSYWGPLTQGWGPHQFAFEPAKAAALPPGGTA